MCLPGLALAMRLAAATPDDLAQCASPVDAVQPSTAVAAVDSQAPFGAPVDASVLDGTRGGTGTDWTQLGWIQEHATVNNNVIYSTINGANSVAQGALEGASGIATVIQNSGNHVIIQNALVLNLTLE